MSSRTAVSYRRATLTALALTLSLVCGCNDDEALRAFRDAAASSLQAGVDSIAGGIIDGAFAVFELGADETGGSDTSGDTEGSEGDASSGG
jgi:hypothetical protein